MGSNLSFQPFIPARGRTGGNLHWRYAFCSSSLLLEGNGERGIRPLVTTEDRLETLADMFPLLFPTLAVL